MVVGSDRVREFDTILRKYNDVRTDMVIITLIKLVSYRQVTVRFGCEEEVSMSASKMRAALC